MTKVNRKRKGRAKKGKDKAEANAPPPQEVEFPNSNGQNVEHVSNSEQNDGPHESSTGDEQETPEQIQHHQLQPNTSNEAPNSEHNDGPQERSTDNGQGIPEQTQHHQLPPEYSDKAPNSEPQINQPKPFTEIVVDNNAPRGLRMVARIDVPPGTLIIEEGPLLSVNKNPNHVLYEDVEPKYKSLGPIDKAHYDCLFPSKNAKSKHPFHAIFLFNRFRTSDSSAAVFPTVGILNHSCLPNAQAAYNLVTGKLAVRTLHGVRKGQELLIMYSDGDSLAFKTLEERRKVLNKFKLECRCPMCLREMDEKQPVWRTKKEKLAQIYKNLHHYLHDNPSASPLSERAIKFSLVLRVIEGLNQQGTFGAPEVEMWTVAAHFAIAMGLPVMCANFLRTVEPICKNFVGVHHPLYKLCVWNLREVESWSPTQPDLLVNRRPDGRLEGGRYSLICHDGSQDERWQAFCEEIGWHQ
ncbi:MAG: hypothetical protein M1831_003743 [Alyxoria varia]|nr:MAG: hypothetical protein M1831_003743 [Alyxoria varia]